MQRCVLQVVQAYIKCMLESVEAVVASDVRISSMYMYIHT